VILLRFPWETDSGPAAPVAEAVDLAPTPKKRGRRPAAAPSADAAATDWLYHELTLTGPATELERFATAARGAGIIPWALDLAAIEEDVFNLAVAQPVEQRGLTVEGCRLLARQFRARVEARHAQALALRGHSQACPLDLFVLLPIPAELLQLGARHPSAQTWLAAHWGADALRQVARRDNPRPGQRLPRGQAVLGYRFYTLERPPAAAIAALATAWPALRFKLQTRPAEWTRGWRP
jgi:hypothetical protein